MRLCWVPTVEFKYIYTVDTPVYRWILYVYACGTGEFQRLEIYIYLYILVYIYHVCMNICLVEMDFLKASFAVSFLGMEIEIQMIQEFPRISKKYMWYWNVSCPCELSLLKSTKKSIKDMRMFFFLWCGAAFFNRRSIRWTRGFAYGMTPRANWRVSRWKLFRITVSMRWFDGLLQWDTHCDIALYTGLA